MAEFPKKITDDPYGAAVLIRRLVVEQGLGYWRQYLTAFALMAVVAAASAGATYVLGQVINQAYVNKNVAGIAALSGVTVLLLFIKGIGTYGHTVILSKISNAILAHNQRQLFAKLMSESIGFFSERHSSEFLARMTAGAKAITDLLNMLINAIGRDFLVLIAMIAVMVSQDPILSLIGLVVVPPAMLMLRKLVKRIKGLAHTQFTGTASIMETMQESLQGIRTVKAFTLEAAMQRRIDGNIAAVEHNANKMARVSNRSNPLMEMLGGFAVAGCLLYAGYSVVALNSTPGQFFSFMTASRLNALMTRKPWIVSCIASRISAPPPYCVSTMERTRLISLRRKKNAGGAMMKPPSAMIGSWITITIVRPISDIKSRPMAVMRRLMTWLTAAAPVVSRAMNSDEWRSAKKPMSSCNSLSNRRR